MKTLNVFGKVFLQREWQSSEQLGSLYRDIDTGCQNFLAGYEHNYLAFTNLCCGLL